MKKPEIKKFFRWLNTDGAAALIVVVIVELFTKPSEIAEKVRFANSVVRRIHPRKISEQSRSI